jgi:hypothetical protein
VTGTQIREREGTRDMRGGTFARPPE